MDVGALPPSSPIDIPLVLYPRILLVLPISGPKSTISGPSCAPFARATASLLLDAINYPLPLHGWVSPGQTCQHPQCVIRIVDGPYQHDCLAPRLNPPPLRRLLLRRLRPYPGMQVFCGPGPRGIFFIFFASSSPSPCKSSGTLTDPVWATSKCSLLDVQFESPKSSTLSTLYETPLRDARHTQVLRRYQSAGPGHPHGTTLSRTCFSWQ